MADYEPHAPHNRKAPKDEENITYLHNKGRQFHEVGIWRLVVPVCQRKIYFIDYTKLCFHTCGLKLQTCPYCRYDSYEHGQ